MNGTGRRPPEISLLFPKETCKSVIKAEHGSYTTKGDNNRQADGAPVEQKEVLGKVIFWIPKAGYAAAFLQTAKGAILTGTGLAAFLLIGHLLPERKKRGGGYEAD